MTKHTLRKNLSILMGATLLAIGMVGFSFQADAFFDDFEKGKLGDDWQKSPVGQDASWTIEKGSLVFSGGGGQSQMMTGKPEWRDYTVECDIKFVSPMEWPGGIRTYVDAKTGGHYAVWFYPVQKMIRLYSGTAWDINTGIVTLGEHRPFDPKLNMFYHVKVIHQGKRIEVWFGDKKENLQKIIEANDDKYKSGLFAFDGWDKPLHFDNVLITGPGIPRSPGELAVFSKGKLPFLWGRLKGL
ncbi:DUF1080 domain-containing protein [Candidatus Poribacteria bacterium]|nr:DUF1080 domain-containing protein [Candidatus Poribacteria bacterium]